MSNLPNLSNLNLGPDLYLGIDVSKDRLDLCLKGQGGTKSFAVPNTLAACVELAKILIDLSLGCIVVEATGGYERVLVETALSFDLPTAVVNPRKARSFAIGLGWLAKTDKLDALMLSEYGRLAKPRVLEAKTLKDQGLVDLCRRRKQIAEMIVAEKNRLRLSSQQYVVRRLKAHLTFLKKELEAISKEIEGVIENRPEQQERFELMQTMAAYNLRSKCEPEGALANVLQQR